MAAGKRPSERPRERQLLGLMNAASRWGRRQEALRYRAEYFREKAIALEEAARGLREQADGIDAIADEEDRKTGDGRQAV